MQLIYKDKLLSANKTHYSNKEEALHITKDYTKQKFSDWFTCQINTGLENGQELDDIEIDYRLSVLKPLHAK